MQVKQLQLKRALRTALLILLLSAVGMGKMYADFYNVTIGDLRYDLNDNTLTATVKGHVNGQAATGSLIIPETVSYEGTDYSVTTIGSNAFYNCSGLTGNLIIPNSVITIGEFAFDNCSGFMGSLVIPNSVATIGTMAFLDCVGFTSVTCFAETPPALGDFYYIYTGHCVFSGWSANTPIYVPCGCEESYASSSWVRDGFSDFVGMCGGIVTLVSIEEEYGTVTGGGAFEAGQTCTIIATANEGHVFTGWTHDDRLVSLDSEYTFYVAGDMTFEAHFMPEGNIVFADATVKSICVANWDTDEDGELSYSEAAAVTSLGQVFSSNVTITTFDELQFFTGLTHINKLSFYGCSGLSSITIPNTVTVIGSSAFESCSGLSSISIPALVDTFGSRAFYGCSSLSSVYFEGNVARWCRINFIQGSNPLIQAHNLYIDNCLVTDLVIPEGVTEIKTYAFYGATCLTSLTLPNSVTTIGNSAFSSCSGFTGSLTIPNSVTTIGNSAFSSCSGFTGGLTIPNSVTTIGRSAFDGCSSFTDSLTIGNSVTTIGESAFRDCSGFTGSLTIGNSVTSIGNYAFQNCSGFTGDLTIPNSVTSIRNYAFQNCSGFIGSLTIGNSVTTIGSNAFSDCSCLTEAMVLEINPPLLGYRVFDNTNFPIYVPYESLNDYKTATIWSNYESRIFPMVYQIIPGYGEGVGNYRFIVSPLVENTAPTAVDNMITETDYDLYRFNQSEELEWENYEANTEDFILENGQGYLYANAEETNIIFKGTFNEDEMKDVELAYDANAEFPGWNLVGNPFPVSAYADRSYYVMSEDGTGLEPVAVSMETTIPTCMGIMVKADGTGESVTFSTTAPEAATNQGALQIALSQVPELVEGPSRNQVGVSTGSTTLLDKTIVSFNEGDKLEKFVFGKADAQVSIPQGGKEYAIAYFEKQGELPLNFKAVKNGTYTLSVKTENVEMDYLHLIDNMTGVDVDLLDEPSYTFESKTTDYASRFRMVFSVCGDADGDDAIFAFFSDDNLIVSNEGEATLQVVDMQGRIVKSQAINGSVSMKVATTAGIYVIRLINGDDVKTQKLVVK